MFQRPCPEDPPLHGRGVRHRSRWSPVPGLRTTGASGFTLIELMIVAAIVGILSAIALPQYRRAVAVSEASTSILEAVAFAEQCAVAHKTGLRTVVDPPGGPARDCNGTSARLIQSRRWSADATGVLCLGVPAGGADRQAVLRVSGNQSPIIGTIECSFQP